MPPFLKQCSGALSPGTSPRTNSDSCSQPKMKCFGASSAKNAAQMKIGFSGSSALLDMRASWLILTISVYGPPLTLRKNGVGQERWHGCQKHLGHPAFLLGGIFSGSVLFHNLAVLSVQNAAGHSVGRMQYIVLLSTSAGRIGS